MGYRAGINHDISEMSTGYNECLPEALLVAQKIQTWTFTGMKVFGVARRPWTSRRKKLMYRIRVSGLGEGHREDRANKGA